MNAFRLEALNTKRSPLPDIGANVLRIHFRIIPSRTSGTEVGTRIQDPRPYLLSVIDALARLHHSFRIHFAGGKRRGDTVREKQQRIDGVFVDPAFTKQVNSVVCVEI